MIGTKCPGQDMRYWKAEDVHEEACPYCGTGMEFFKTDVRLRCPSCRRKVVNRNFNLGCAAWCAYAEQCLGPAAAGLKPQSLKNAFFTRLEKVIDGGSDGGAVIEEVISRAEEVSREKNYALPAILLALIVTVAADEKQNNPESVLEALEKVVTEETLPPGTENLTREILTAQAESELGEARELVRQLACKLTGTESCAVHEQCV